MRKKFLQMFFVIFIIAFSIDYSLVYFFPFNSHEPPQINQKMINIPENQLDQYLKLNISGEQLIIIKDYCIQNKIDFAAYLSQYIKFHDPSVPFSKAQLELIEPESMSNTEAKKLYDMVFKDVECFPIKIKDDADRSRYSYTDTYLAERTYGGDRKHMGTDIMDDNNESGYFKIVSMTDGKIENLGWLELGGYRVGIRSEGGAYFYYAHLASYAEGLKEGDTVKAGQLLGYMGSTGYGKEGTNDQFDVHLHVGISLMVNATEQWVNPYAILQMLEQK